MTREEIIKVLQTIEDREVDFLHMTACDWVAIAAAKRHLQEEPVSEDLDLGCGVIWKCEEPVSEDLEEATSKYAKSEYDRKNPATLPERCKGCYAPIMYAFKAGAKWQKKYLWKPADGEDLPEIDREVIVLLNNGMVAFGHRPPEYWVKNIDTGKFTRNYVKRYDKGQWNQPNIKYWLDLSIPNLDES